MTPEFAWIDQRVKSAMETYQLLFHVSVENSPVKLVSIVNFLMSSHPYVLKLKYVKVIMEECYQGRRLTDVHVLFTEDHTTVREEHIVTQRVVVS